MEWDPIPTPPCQLGESPFWHPEEQSLYWIDIVARKVYRHWFPAGPTESWDLPTEPGCIAPGRSGGLVISLRDGFYRARQWQGRLEPLALTDHDTKTTRFNDGKADPLGRFWAGTMYEPRDVACAKLFSLDCRRDNSLEGKPILQSVADGVVISNGLAWSPDNKTMYWADTPNHVIYSWDWEAKSNRISHRRLFYRASFKPNGWQAGQDGYLGRPDGAAVDEVGDYWVAMFEGSRLLKLTPEGHPSGELHLPFCCPTMPCFGGPDLRTIFVTSASYQRSAEELQAFPLSGHIVAKRVDVPGLPVNYFED